MKEKWKYSFENFFKICLRIKFWEYLLICLKQLSSDIVWFKLDAKILMNEDRHRILKCAEIFCKAFESFSESIYIQFLVERASSTG